MARIVLIGAGVVGLGAAMLLAGDGHQLTVLERDPAMPPAEPVDAWERWQRPGVNQFRLPHSFLARFRAVLDAELPEVAAALQAAGGLRRNFIRDVLPAEMTGGWRDGDERYEVLTGRRPVVEAVFAAQAEKAPGVEVRRGTAVTGLLSGAAALPGVPHVVGVRTKAGESIPADLVVDMSGRRSALPDWLQGIGAQRPAEELEDSGFMYYGCHFRSADGSLPTMLGPAVMHWGTITSLTMAADNGSWAVGIVTGSNDKALRGTARRSPVTGIGLARSRRLSAVKPTSRTTPGTTCRWLSALPPVKTRTACGPGWTSSLCFGGPRRFSPRPSCAKRSSS
jgi:2-polyprenyl-6-methoxyphenol hydroxylase-like FAD-dependent oxidoreductase